MTPLWIPRVADGARHALCDAEPYVAGARPCGRHLGAVAEQTRHDPRTADIPPAFGVFLFLLAAGMAVPFAIAVPAVVYLLLQDGLTALKGIGLVSWGSMNSFTLTAIPLFMLMAEMMQRSGLSFRIYRGLAKVVSRLPGGLLQTNIVGCALFASISGSSRRDRRIDRRRRAAATGAAQLRPHAVGGLARGGRHAGHSVAAQHRHDHLRLVHRDLGGQAVHGGRRSPA